MMNQNKTLYFIFHERNKKYNAPFHTYFKDAIDYTVNKKKNKKKTKKKK